MAFKDTVPCPLGEKCPNKTGSKIPKHRTGSFTYKTHSDMANGKISTIDPSARGAISDFNQNLEKSENSDAKKRADGTISFIGIGKGKKWFEAQKEINEAMVSEIEEGISNIVLNKEELDRFIEFSKNAYNYSYLNTILLMLQKRTGSNFKTKPQWEALGYKVNYNASMASIRRPIFKEEPILDENGNIKKDENGKPLTTSKLLGYKFYGVYSERDLDASHKEPPQHPLVSHFERYKNNPNIDDNKALREDLKTVANELGVTITYKNKDNDSTIAGGAGGYATKIDGKYHVIIDDNSQDHAKTRTLAHELGHILNGDLDDKNRDYSSNRPDMETEAEIVAYAISKDYGFDIGESTFPYLKSWSTGNSEQVENSMETVSKSLRKYYKTLDKAVNNTTIEEENSKANEIAYSNKKKKKK